MEVPNYRRVPSRGSTRLIALLVVAASVASYVPQGAIAASGSDSFSGAFALPPASTELSDETTVGATAEPLEPDHAGSPAKHSRWYSLTVAPGELTAQVCDSPAGFSVQPRIAVYIGSTFATLQPVASAASPIGSLCAFVPFGTSSPTTFMIAVDDTGASGAFRLRVEYTPAPPPSQSTGTPSPGPTGIPSSGGCGLLCKELPVREQSCGKFRTESVVRGTTRRLNILLFGVQEIVPEFPLSCNTGRKVIGEWAETCLPIRGETCRFGGRKGTKRYTCKLSFSKTRPVSKARDGISCDQGIESPESYPTAFGNVFVGWSVLRRQIPFAVGFKQRESS